MATGPKAEGAPALATSRTRLAAFAGGVAWPVEEGVEIGPPGHEWWPCFAGTSLAVLWAWDEDGRLLGARDIMWRNRERHPGLTWAPIRAVRAYCQRHIALFQAQGWLDAMGNDDFPMDDEDAVLRADVAAILAALEALEAEVRALRQALAGIGAA